MSLSPTKTMKGGETKLDDEVFVMRDKLDGIIDDLDDKLDNVLKR
jgi:hypothetical protein